MSKLDELKKLAEAAQDDPWFKVEAVYKALCVSDITVSPDRDARFIAAMSPATILKLLEMIAVFREAEQRWIENVPMRLEVCEHGRMHCSHTHMGDLIKLTRDRVDEIERSL